LPKHPATKLSSLA